MTNQETSTKTYNGWTNYETWAVKLWMDNDEGEQDHWTYQADKALSNPPVNTFQPDPFRRSVYALAETLKDEHQEALPELDGFAGDLLNAALSEVNWYEIAESLLKDAQERADD